MAETIDLIKKWSLLLEGMAPSRQKEMAEMMEAQSQVLVRELELWSRSVYIETVKKPLEMPNSKIFYLNYEVKLKKPTYNGTCPLCGKSAFIMAFGAECSNSGCSNYK